MGRRTTKKPPATGRIERLRHVGWAGLIALVLTLLTLFQPIDQIGRLVQYATSSTPASGDIAFIATTENLDDPQFPARRRQLAEAITRIDRAGAKAIYVDMAFEEETDPASDSALHRALRDTRGRARLVELRLTGIDGAIEWHSSVPAIGEGIPVTASHFWINYMGYAWDLSYTLEENGRRLPNLAVELAGIEPPAGDPSQVFPINYYFDLQTIPIHTLTNLRASPDIAESLAGKTVVIGPVNPTLRPKPSLPGLPDVAPSLVQIYAAETLKAGFTTVVGGTTTLLATLALLVLAVLPDRRKWRRSLYVAVCLAMPVGLLVAAQLYWQVDAGGAFAFFPIYAIFRARARWKRGFRLVDAETNIPTFAALEAEKEVAETLPAIIVAKIHRFEEVRRSLPPALHAEYLLRIIARLRAATQDATIYVGQGHLIAWTTPEKDPALLREHLEGLRALFSSPLLVGDNQVDVGITFGIDITRSPNVARRLATAVSVAEHTNETFEPIAISDGQSEEDLIWNISLQARIDAALASGEIYLVYQPKISVQTGKMIGVEALVRWHDPVRGHISPDHFIRQCENAGRMSHLTRHVLYEACNAGLQYAARGMPLPIAVNISATLLHERAVVRMVEQVLGETGYDPRHLLLEITETYRISNLERAAEILSALQDLGLKISMDDFGVGAASLEALMRLPFSELKIDRLFIGNMVADGKAREIVRSVLAMGREMGITVVAEGVEDGQTLNLLRDSGCDVAQGFAISRPIGFEEVFEFKEFSGRSLIQNMV